jgi:arylsulfatase A-like enzyme
MAAQAVRLTECYATPLCSQSRFMQPTGKYSFRNYTYWGLWTLVKNYCQHLADGGYKELVVGKLICTVV